MFVMCSGMTNSYMFSHRRAARPPVQASSRTKRVQGNPNTGRAMPHHRPPVDDLDASYYLVRNELKSSLSFPVIAEKITESEKLARAVGSRSRLIHEAVVNNWNRFKDPTKLCTLLDEKITKLNQKADNRRAQGKSLRKAKNWERVPRYLDLAVEYLRINYSEDELKTYRGIHPCPISLAVFGYCDEQFLLKFPQLVPSDSLQKWKDYRHSTPSLRIYNVIEKALLKQGPQDPSSSQTGDLPTPSYHGLGLLAMAASNAANSLHLDVEPPNDSRSLDQLLQAMDPRQESDVPDSDNDGRGASESLCSSDGYDDPGKDSPSSGSGERTRQSAGADPCRSDGDRLRAQFMRGMTKRYHEMKLTDSSSGLTRPLSATGGRRAAPRDSADARAAAGAAAGAAAATGAAGGGATASLESAFPCQIGDGARSAAAGADAGGVGGAQAGGVGGAQASGTGGELTFTESLPLCLNRLTAARADWQPPPICQCRSID